MEEPCKREPGESATKNCSFHCSVRWYAGLKLLVMDSGFYIADKAIKKMQISVIAPESERAGAGDGQRSRPFKNLAIKYAFIHRGTKGILESMVMD